MIPEHRARFVGDFEALAAEFGLAGDEKVLIRYGIGFFLLEKTAPAVGQSNPEVYVSMRGEDLETFQKTRNVAIQYSVAGGEGAKQLDAR